MVHKCVGCKRARLAVYGVALLDKDQDVIERAWKCESHLGLCGGYHPERTLACMLWFRRMPTVTSNTPGAVKGAVLTPLP